MKILHTIQQPNQFQYMIFCPACKCGHGIRVGQQTGSNWDFNGNMEKPSFSPSLLISGVNLPDVDPETGDWKRGFDGNYILDENGRISGSKNWVCHSWITDGMIKFFDDSTHELKGQTVPLEEFWKMNFYVYMVECVDNTYYTGYSNDVDQRILKHNSGKGAKYTRSRRPVRLVYKKLCNNKSEALREEVKIKKLTRKQKMNLICPCG